MKTQSVIRTVLLVALIISGISILAQNENLHRHDHPIDAELSDDIAPEWDIIQARVARFGDTVIFHQIIEGEAGSVIPEEVGQLAGAEVLSYVFPTSLNSDAVGFESDAGILALALTSHPDFDDTPLWDEDGDGDTENDGREWHSHWVVLVEHEACEGGLAVRDIPEGETPQLPETAPGLPLYIDSPDYDFDLTGNEVVVYVPYDAIDNPESFQFDAVTAGLRVNVDLHAPLLCVTDVNDIASGDLSLPGEAR